VACILFPKLLEGFQLNLVMDTYSKYSHAKAILVGIGLIYNVHNPHSINIFSR